MNGKGFAFAAWVRLNIERYGWNHERHGWCCPPCRDTWIELQRRWQRTGYIRVARAALRRGSEQ